MSNRKTKSEKQTISTQIQRFHKDLTKGQKAYVRSIHSNKITMCLGPAGSGKTSHATHEGCIGLLMGHFKRLIITRPMVMADEDTGFLPGDLHAKMKPFLIPIYEEMQPYVDKQTLQKHLHEESIEVCTFAHMRGRNFHDCFIIVDEAQNATKKQLKMLLTRIGRNSKMVVTGDYTQSDLREHEQGGLLYWMKVTNRVPNIGHIELSNEDIKREQIVTDILEASEDYDNRIEEEENEPPVKYF